MNFVVAFFALVMVLNIVVGLHALMLNQYIQFALSCVFLVCAFICTKRAWTK